MAKTPQPDALASNHAPIFTMRASRGGGEGVGVSMRELYEKYIQRTRENVGIIQKMDTIHDRLRAARQEAGFDTAAAAAEAHGWNRNTYSSNENGNAPFSYRRAKEYGAAFGVRPEWLYDASGPRTPAHEGLLAPVVGRVGANPDGAILYATGQGEGEVVPLPPGGSEKAVALRVVGHSMPGLADDGALIYFEDQRTPPTLDMLGHIVVVETTNDEVLIKRLLRGSKADRFDLESLAGPTLRDARLRWAAHITAIIPPFQARKIIRSSGA